MKSRKSEKEILTIEVPKEKVIKVKALLRGEDVKIENSSRSTAKKGIVSLPYKVIMKLKGREFVKDNIGEWHEVDRDGNLIPDHLVKPL